MASPRLELPGWLAEYRGRRILAGFSGGADSTALLLALVRDGFRVEAVHFEHGVRGDAGRADAEYCRDFAGRLGVPFTLRELQLTAGANFEARARAARLAAWRELAGSGDDCAAALGHHAGDAAETLLMRLARGGNATALAALRPVRRVAGVTFLRPLLGFEREEIEAFLLASGVGDWRCDATNADSVFHRNYLRNRLLPEWRAAFPAAKGGIAAALAALADDARYLEESARRAYRERPAGEGLNAEWFDALAPALRVRVLRLWLARTPDRRLLERMTGRRRGRIPLAGGGELEYRRGFWHFDRGAPDLPWEWPRQSRVEWNGCRLTAEEAAGVPEAVTPDEAYFDADRLPRVLWLTRRRRGDVIVPFGRTETKPLKRFGPALSVLRDADGVVYWAAGCRHSDQAKVTAETRRIVRFYCRFMSRTASTTDRA